MIYVLSYLQGAAVPDEAPNADTLEAFAELEDGGGHKFSGTTEQLFVELMGDKAYSGFRECHISLDWLLIYRAKDFQSNYPS